MTDLISIVMLRRLLLIIFLNQGDTKSIFLYLSMITLQGTSPPGAARQGCLYLSISLQSIGIAIGRQLFKQVILEQISLS